jgi:hypothetical protein
MTRQITTYHCYDANGNPVTGPMELGEWYHWEFTWTPANLPTVSAEVKRAHTEYHRRRG